MSCRKVNWEGQAMVNSPRRIRSRRRPGEEENKDQIVLTQV